MIKQSYFGIFVIVDSICIESLAYHVRALSIKSHWCDAKQTSLYDKT